MIIIIKKGADAAQVEHLKEMLRSRNISPHESKGELQTMADAMQTLARPDATDIITEQVIKLCGK